MSSSRAPRKRRARRHPSGKRAPASDGGAPGHSPLRATASWQARILPALPYLVLAAAFAHNLHYSWLKWGDPVVDFGRELEVARLIAQGEVLYRDVRHYFGPLAPYVNGALFSLFGVHAGVLMAAGAASAAMMGLVLHLLARRFGDRLMATVVAAAFFYLCAFGHYLWNGIFTWAAPYTYSATYGMLAATASLWLLVRHVQEGRALDLHLSLACLVLAGLGKLEPFAAVAAAHIVFLATMRRGFGVYAAAGVAGLGVLGVFWFATGSRLLADYLQFSTSVKFRPVILVQTGLVDWTKALAPVGRSAGACAAVIALSCLASVLERRAQISTSGRWLTAAACAAGAGFVYSQLGVFDTFRSLPFLLAGLLAWHTLRWWRAGSQRRLVVPQLLLVAFALVCVARMPLTTGASHYGFYLLPVPLVAFATFLFRDLPQSLPARPARLFASAGVGLFAAVAVTHYGMSTVAYDQHTTTVRTAQGTMVLLDELAGFPTGRAYADTLRLLSTYAPHTRVLAVPEGVGLTFLAGLTSVCGLHSFLPPELDGPFEDRLLACLENAPPDLVLHVGLDLQDFGSSGFGADYGQKIGAWILEHYDAIHQFGPQGYVVVLQRRAS